MVVQNHLTPVIGSREGRGTERQQGLRAREKRKDKVKSSNKRELEKAQDNRKSQKEVKEGMAKEEAKKTAMAHDERMRVGKERTWRRVKDQGLGGATAGLLLPQLSQKWREH